MYNKIINIIEHLRRIFILQILFYYNHHRWLHVVSDVKLKWKTPFYRFCSTYMLEKRFVLIEFWSLNVDVFLNVLEKYAISPFRV